MNKELQNRLRWQICIHEMGHILLAYIYDEYMHFEKARVYFNGIDRLTQGKFSGNTQGRIYLKTPELYLAKRIIAGELAEKIWRKRYNCKPKNSLKVFFNKISGTSEDDFEIEKLNFPKENLKKIGVQVTHLLNRNWNFIEWGTNILYNTGKLNRDDVIKYFK